MPAHDIHKLKGNEEAPDIPTRILYYLGVVLTDPQIFEIVECLRVGFVFVFVLVLVFVSISIDGMIMCIIHRKFSKTRELSWIIGRSWNIVR